ncbi:MAG: metallophosphoesterase [Thermoplasmataceae archaeon]
MHISDTHLGSRQYSIREREDDFYDSFTEAVDIAIDSGVDFIVHSGDLFDEHRPENRALSVFRDNVIKLQSRNIPIYMIMGDHDRPKRDDIPASAIFDFLGVKVLGMEGYESIVHSKDKEEILIGGISNMKGIRRDRLKGEYERANLDASNHGMSVLLSHQAISPFFISEQSEATVEELPVNFNYMAFGHIHSRMEKRVGNSIFSYAGSTEIKSTNELESFMRIGKSVNIVSIDGDITKVERRKLNSVRPQLEVVGNFHECITSLDKFISINRSILESKKGILTAIINEDLSMQDVQDALSKYTDLFFIRTPIIKSQVSQKYSAPSTTESLRELFTEYFDDDHGKGELAYDFFRIILDNEPEDVMINLNRKLDLEVE